MDDGCFNEVSQDGSIEDTCASSSTGQHNQLGTVYLHSVPIVSLFIEGKERLCLAQISNTLLKNYSYNEIHNRRVALGITCVQCTPVQLELLRRAGAMPVSSRRCGMITRREAERLVKSFLDEISPPKLPENFAFELCHKCGWGCRGSFLPARYNSSRAKCIRCFYCHVYFSPNKFIFHCHRPEETGETEVEYRHPDAANFNAWRRHLYLGETNPSEELGYAWEDVKAMFNGGNRKRILSHSNHRNTGSTTPPEEACRDRSPTPPEPKRAHRSVLPPSASNSAVQQLYPGVKTTNDDVIRPAIGSPTYKLKSNSAHREATWQSNPPTSPDNMIAKAYNFDPSYNHMDNWVPDLLGLKPAWQMLWSRHLALLQKGRSAPNPLETLPTSQSMSMNFLQPTVPYPGLQGSPIFSQICSHGMPPTHCFPGASPQMSATNMTPQFFNQFHHPLPPNSVGVDASMAKIKFEKKQIEFRDDITQKLPEIVFPCSVPNSYSIESLIKEKTESI